jgi:hypothetical protein
MWAWSRTAEQVVWVGDAAARVLQIATEHGEKYRYATEIPIVEPNEQKVKLARLAVATAAMLFSASEDGQRVLVTADHVRFAADFLESLYAKPSLAFDDYAAAQRRKYHLEDAGKVKEIVSRTGMGPKLLMEQSLLTQRDLQEILAYDDLKETREAVSVLRDAGFFVRQGTSGYVKTPAAITWLRRLIAEANGTARPLVAQTVPEDEDFPAW